MFSINGFWLLVFGFVVLFLVGAANAWAEHKEVGKTKKFLLSLMWGSSMILYTLIFALMYALN